MTFKLSTPIKIPAAKDQYDSNAMVAGIGSCFSQNLLDKLFELGQPGYTNPNGIVYNAVSIAYAIGRAVDNRPYTTNDFFEFNGLWHSWHHHGKFSHPELSTAVAQANTAMNDFRQTLERCSMFVVTPSTSVVYKLLPDNLITTNCHKMPQQNFQRTVLSIDENKAALNTIVEKVKELNAGCRIVFTLSPVRHAPGNLPLNARSKANLLAAIHDCLEDNPDSTQYFPAYEILLDELRDYRFYSEDMLHPSPLAEKIIFSRFTKTFFSTEAIHKMNEAEKRLKANAHRPLH